MLNEVESSHQQAQVQSIEITAEQRLQEADQIARHLQGRDFGDIDTYDQIREQIYKLARIGEGTGIRELANEIVGLPADTPWSIRSTYIDTENQEPKYATRYLGLPEDTPNKGSDYPEVPSISERCENVRLGLPPDTDFQTYEEVAQAKSKCEHQERLQELGLPEMTTGIELQQYEDQQRTRAIHQAVHGEELNLDDRVDWKRLTYSILHLDIESTTPEEITSRIGDYREQFIDQVRRGEIEL